MLPEEWRPHPKYGDLVQASSLGRVRQFIVLEKQWVLLPHRMHKHGYLMVSLRAPVLKCGIKEHALVAECWYGTRPPGNDVAHKDGNKTNNRPDNLMFCSRRVNASHRRGHGTLKCPAIVACSPARSDSKGRWPSGRCAACGKVRSKWEQRCLDCTKRSCASCGRPFVPISGAPIGRFCSRACTGRRAGNGKLSGEDVTAIRSAVATGASCRAVATEYGVSSMTVSRIVRRVKWSHAP